MVAAPARWIRASTWGPVRHSAARYCNPADPAKRVPAHAAVPWHQWCIHTQRSLWPRSDQFHRIDLLRMSSDSGKLLWWPSQTAASSMTFQVNRSIRPGSTASVYGTSTHPALTLHPNAGITFDLDQIRQDNPDIQIDRFTAVCSIPKDLPQTQFSSADVWVLLDGVVRLHLHYPPERHVAEKVDVPIPARTRFLTLVTTCSGRADYSWIFFGDPFLEPAATK